MLFYVNMFVTLGPFKCYVMQMGHGGGGGGVKFSLKKALLRCKVQHY